MRGRIEHKRGLSLVETLVGVTAIAVLGVTVAAYVSDASEREGVQQTRIGLADVAATVERYEEERAELPRDLLELRSEDYVEPRALMDAWGREIVYRELSGGEFELVSAGPDGLDGSDDDIAMRF